MEPSTVAGWQEFRDKSLPCVGLTEETRGFTPYTGRHIPADTSPLAASDTASGGSPSDAFTEINQTLSNTVHNRSSTISGNVNKQKPVDRILSAPSSFNSLVSSLESLQSPEVRRRHLTNSPNPRRQNKSTNRYSLPLKISVKGTSNNSTSQDCANLHKELQNIFSPAGSGRSSPALSLTIPENSCRSLSAPSTPYHLASPFANTPPESPKSPLAMNLSSSSLFSVSSQDASSMVKQQLKEDDNRHCYFLQLTFKPLFSEDNVPGACLRKIPRLVNGIPLGAGFLSRDQLNRIKWRLVEGGHSNQTFLSHPLYKEEAEETKTLLRDRLVKQAQAVFGDITIKTRIVLSRCEDYDDDFVVNDIAVNLEEGLHFKD